MIATQAVLLARAKRNDDNWATALSPAVKYARYSELLEKARKNGQTLLAAYYERLVNDALDKLKGKDEKE